MCKSTHDLLSSSALLPILPRQLMMQCTFLPRRGYTVCHNTSLAMIRQGTTFHAQPEKKEPPPPGKTPRGPSCWSTPLIYSRALALSGGMLDIPGATWWTFNAISLEGFNLSFGGRGGGSNQNHMSQSTRAMCNHLPDN